ncbi:hypothetical protein Tco_0921706 [Tanacetum coccineum]
MTGGQLFCDKGLLFLRIYNEGYGSEIVRERDVKGGGRVRAGGRAVSAQIRRVGARDGGDGREMQADRYVAAILLEMRYIDERLASVVVIGSSFGGIYGLAARLCLVGTLATIKSLKKPCITGFMKPINSTLPLTPPLNHHSPPPTSSSMIVTPSTPKPTTTKPLYHRMSSLL